MGFSLPIKAGLLGILLSLFFLFPSSSEALVSAKSNPYEVSATVGDFYLDISGYVSPYASVVLYINGEFVRAAVADQGGNFSISQVLIKAGFSNFCLEAVDFKRIGESYTCISIPPAQGSVKKDKIFLPPTLGLSKTSVAEGEEFEAFGYTMPNARVTLNLGNGRTESVLADGTGYYIFRIKNLPAGRYELYATANYDNQDSLSPTKKVELRSLSWWEQIIAFLKELWERFLKMLSSIALGPLWLGLPILILIIILILKLWPERLTNIYNRKILPLIPGEKAKHHLHHFWLFHE